MSTSGSSAVERLHPHDHVVRSGEVIWRRVDDEIVVLNEDGTTLTTLNLTATIAWEAMDGAISIAAIAERISERFDVAKADVLNDLLELCNGLRDAGLVLNANHVACSVSDSGPHSS